MRASALVALLILSGCSGGIENRAEEIVRHDMLDPAATNFREVAVIKGTECVAGEVNAKNRMGAYTGFRPFIVNVPAKKYAVAPDLSGKMTDDQIVGLARMDVLNSECKP